MPGSRAAAAPTSGNNVETLHPAETSHAHSMFYFHWTKSFHAKVAAPRPLATPVSAEWRRLDGWHYETVMAVVAVVEQVTAAGFCVAEEQEGLAGLLQPGGRLAQRQAWCRRLVNGDRRAKRVQPAGPRVSKLQPVAAGDPVDRGVLAGGLLGEQVEVVVHQLGFRDCLIRCLAGQRVGLAAHHGPLLRRAGIVGQPCRRQALVPPLAWSGHGTAAADGFPVPRRALQPDP